MTIPAPPVSSVVRMAQEACRLEGVSYTDFLMANHSRGFWSGIRQRVVWRMRETAIGRTQPSFPEIAAAIGATNHSTAITAYQRECRRLDRELMNHRIKVGLEVAARA